MAKKQTYYFDYKGINDGLSPYRERLATFSLSVPSNEVIRHGKLWEASPDLLEFVQDVAMGKHDIHSLQDDAKELLSRIGLSLNP